VATAAMAVMIKTVVIGRLLGGAVGTGKVRGGQ
jgi:hypothetical protein